MKPGYSTEAECNLAIYHAIVGKATTKARRHEEITKEKRFM
jgi:hypothetical protein